MRIAAREYGRFGVQGVWEGAELKRFDIVIANPPFSQNYSTDSMKHKVKRSLPILDAHQGQSGFHVCSAYHQHAQIHRAYGVIMPHGVLFRGGEERKMREWMIRRGYLEAVIGLPPALFYGNRHSRLHSHYQPSRSRYPQGGTLYQCRPRIQGGQGAEHPALRRYREDSLCLSEQVVPPLKPRKPLGKISPAIAQHSERAGCCEC